MAIDLKDPAISASFDALLAVASRRLDSESLVEWLHKVGAAEDIDQAVDITTELVGLPMSEEERRIAREVRASLALLGDQL